MEFGVPKEVRDLEMRVGLTPAGVLALARAGHTIYIERNAGAGFSDVHYVVTEYGVASLHGRTVRQRARELINIAHPKFREELTKAAHELSYL